MFKKMYRNIYISLMLTSTLLSMLIIIISCLMIANLLYSTHASTAKQKLDWSVSSSRNYINSVMLSTGNLAHENSIFSELVRNIGLPLASILDNACNYAMKINAISVYSSDGRIYSSSNVAGIPALDKLSQNEGIRSFLLSDQPQYVSLRNDNIPKLYNNLAYNSDMGMVTCCQKVYDDDNRTVGYIFADIFPSSLYQYFDYSNDANFQGNLTMIRHGQLYFPYKDNQAYRSDFFRSSGESVTSGDGKLLIVPSARDFFGGSIGIAVPLSTISNTILFLSLLFCAAAALILTGAFVLARKTAKSVNRRLENLLQKMETTIIGMRKS